MVTATPPQIPRCQTSMQLATLSLARRWRSAGQIWEGASLQQHLERPDDNRSNGERWLPLDGVPTVFPGEGHPDRHPLPHQGAVHAAGPLAVRRRASGAAIEAVDDGVDSPHLVMLDGRGLARSSVMAA